ncbi:Panacea domain-containing protein [Candidatus Methanomassiliicoccus intestinalis]|uniref:Panacea domain-containing protein n=1 Tax=Candidatus Methanomassiliicoccus intestinalis TaxID=1406512 RepID=UPI00155A0F35|nr:type II toxin-antitoxin system antitoxin SocA domain-containing protein [Candidatus Methanomassiliicoccus intestinalis]
MRNRPICPWERGTLKWCRRLEKRHNAKTKSLQNGGSDMAYDALDVAKYIIKKYYGMRNPVTNLKLQKMLYFAWIRYYKETKEYLFNDKIEAWMLGPVVPNVYYQYYIYAGIPIREDKEPSKPFSPEAVAVLDKLIEDCMDKTARELVDKAHKNGTPWDRTYKPDEKKTIDFEMIIDVECAA